MGLKGKTFRFNETLDLPVTAIQSEIDFLLTRMGRTCWKAYIAYNGGFTYYYGDRENWASSSIYGRTSGWTYAEDRVIKFMSNGDNADFETWVLANAVEIPSEIEVYTDENGVDHHFRDDSMPTLLGGKADKVSSPTSGNFAALDSNGNLTDSGSKASDFLTQHQDISGKVNGPSSAVNNQVAVFDGTTGKAIKDSGFTIGKSVPSDAVFTDTWRPIEGTTASPSVDAAFSSIAGNALKAEIEIQRQNGTMNSTYLSEGNAVCLKIGDLLCVQLYDIKFKQAISVSSENNNIVLFTLPFNVSMSHVVFTITPFNPNDNVVRLRIQGNKITPWWSAIQISAGEGYCGSVVSNIV